MLSISAKGMLTAVVAASVFLYGHAEQAWAIHSAYVATGGDVPFPLPNYIGTSNPVGIGQINVSGATPGFLNNISGGGFGGAQGNISIYCPNSNEDVLMALAITVTDAAGPAHSLSNLNDKALSDIIFDLGRSTIHGAIGFQTSRFDELPAHFAQGVSWLSAGEAANGGQPFDIVLVIGDTPGRYRPPYLVWSFDFSNEIGNLDGITAISVTDVGVLPEPVVFPIALLGFTGLLIRRPRCDLLTNRNSLRGGRLGGHH